MPSRLLISTNQDWILWLCRYCLHPSYVSNCRWDVFFHIVLSGMHFSTTYIYTLGNLYEVIQFSQSREIPKQNSWTCFSKIWIAKSSKLPFDFSCHTYIYIEMVRSKWTSSSATGCCQWQGLVNVLYCPLFIRFFQHDTLQNGGALDLPYLRGAVLMGHHQPSRSYCQFWMSV